MNRGVLMAFLTVFIVSVILVGSLFLYGASIIRSKQIGTVDFTSIAKGTSGCSMDSTEKVITSQSEYEELKDLCGLTEDVDMDQETVIAVSTEQKSTGGYGIEITGIKRIGSKAVVSVERTSPGEGCMVTQMLTRPFHVVKVDEKTGDVEFKYKDVVDEC